MSVCETVVTETPEVVPEMVAVAEEAVVEAETAPEEVEEQVTEAAAVVAALPLVEAVPEETAGPITPRESDDLLAEEESDDEDLEMFDISGMHFQESWSLHFSTRIPKNKKSKKSQSTSEESWAKNVHKVSTFSSIEEFWCLYHFMDTLVSIGNMSVQYAIYHYFKGDIEPKWEHPANKDGCTMSIKMHNSKSSEKKFGVMEKVEFKAQFLMVLLSVIGGTSPMHPLVNGVVCKIRPTFLHMEFWLNTNDEAARTVCENEVRAILCSMYSSDVLDKFDFKSHAHEIQRSAASSPRGGSRANSRGGSRGRGDRGGSNSRGGSRGHSRGGDRDGDRRGGGGGRGGDRSSSRGPSNGRSRGPSRGGERQGGRFSRSSSRGPDRSRDY
ncbi:translation Initiation factor eIF- 4e [Kipferlia bialata]|uniref:Translation Initiation factor eIF- 4e n=1 Tax=Kipferlia bialata TaxID=797122 RepID=A0A9K3GFX8_9EUKA|nr:translation Initiation factor eIF- 4e [Kipferlia bialata]|eukprot:g2373.t1